MYSVNSILIIPSEKDNLYIVKLYSEKYQNNKSVIMSYKKDTKEYKILDFINSTVNSKIYENLLKNVDNYDYENSYVDKSELIDFIKSIAYIDRSESSGSKSMFLYDYDFFYAKYKSSITFNLVKDKSLIVSEKFEDFSINLENYKYILHDHLKSKYNLSTLLISNVDVNNSTNNHKIELNYISNKYLENEIIDKVIKNKNLSEEIVKLFKEYVISDENLMSESIQKNPLLKLIEFVNENVLNNDLFRNYLYLNGVVEKLYKDKSVLPIIEVNELNYELGKKGYELNIKTNVQLPFNYRKLNENPLELIKIVFNLYKGEELIYVNHIKRIMNSYNENLKLNIGNFDNLLYYKNDVENNFTFKVMFNLANSFESELIKKRNFFVSTREKYKDELLKSLFSFNMEFKLEPIIKEYDLTYIRNGLLNKTFSNIFYNENVHYEKVNEKVRLIEEKNEYEQYVDLLNIIRNLDKNKDIEIELFKDFRNAYLYNIKEEDLMNNKSSNFNLAFYRIAKTTLDFYNETFGTTKEFINLSNIDNLKQELFQDLSEFLSDTIKNSIEC